jgi:hypothetical protein
VKLLNDPGAVDEDLLQPAARRPVRREQGAGFSPGVILIASMLSTLHLLNFLNYTVIGGYFDPPLARSVLLVAFSLVLVVWNTGNLRFHFERSWDVYAICALAFVSAAYSEDAAKTLKYAAWLVLSVYVGTELAARIRHPRDLVAAAAIVLLPASFLVAAVNVAVGPVVVSTGRQFGALGSAHVDTAYAMDFICLYLAMRIVPEATLRLPAWLKWAMWGVLLWAFYQAIFGLTRSVWLGVLLALGLYAFRRSLNFRSLAATLLLVLAAVAFVGFVGVDRIVPDAVEGRIEVTEQRYDSGEIDPRVEGIRRAWTSGFQHPQGTGYAFDGTHNTYMDVLIQLGWFGFLLAFVAIARSTKYVLRAGFGWFMFFAVGAMALLVHAFFEPQTTPGQANFVPLLLWYALSRARFTSEPERVSRPRYSFVGA